MKIIDEALLQTFRESRCEWCKMPGVCEPHHIFARGMRSEVRMDIAINLIALCRSCHQAVHYGRIYRRDLLAIVAAREGKLQHEIEDDIHKIRRQTS